MDIRSIAHQTPGIDELAQKIERRNFVTRRKLYDLLALSVQKWVRVDKQSIGFLPGEACEDRVDFAFSAGVPHSELQTESAPQPAYRAPRPRSAEISNWSALQARCRWAQVDGQALSASAPFPT